jgi:putative ABC transport system permease protein
MNNQKPTPPAWADRFLSWFCSDELIEEIQGDLHEAYYRRLESQGPRQAKKMFIKDVFRFFRPYAFEKYSRAKQFLPMFNNYFKIAFRNIMHRKSFTGINLFGLAIGVATVMLIGLYLRHEWTYDQQTPSHEQVYRLMNKYREQTYTPMRFLAYAGSSRDTQMRLINHLQGYEDVEIATHFVPSQSAIGSGDQFYVEVDNKRFVAENALYTNTGMSFQDVFPQDFIIGTPETAFSNFNKIILTEPLALKWFGTTWRSQELLGKLLTIRDDIFELGGVIKEVPGNVHYDFNFIIHQERIPSWAAYTYVKLRPGKDITRLVQRINNEVDLIYPGYTKDELSKGISAVALSDIHFTDNTLYEIKPIANRAYLNTFAIIGLVILLIIWTNYTNLSVAMYADRQKELGMRKVMGARPQDISLQLLVEAIVLALLCFPISWLILRGALPYFSVLMDVSFPANVVFDPGFLISLLSLLLLTGVLSGLYPALAYGSRSMLRLFGKRLTSFGGIRYLNFRNVLVTTQFIMIVGLLSMTFFIRQQMNLIQNKDLGFEKEGVLYFNIDGAEKYKQLKQELLKLPEIKDVGANGVPGSDMFNQMTYKLKNTEVTLSDGTEQYLDYGLIKTLKIECPDCIQLDQGKDQMFLINQTAAEKLAKIKGVAQRALIGQTLVTEPEWENEEYGFGIPHTIDGIIDDYKYFSLKYANQPLLINVSKEPAYVYNMIVRADTKNWGATISKIEEAYTGIEKVRPFDFNFLESRLAQLYENEQRSEVLLTLLSLVAIILALMGLAGIVSFIAFSRQKEIGIRKVLGASSGSILFKFNKEFILMMGVATLIAMPLALYLASQWLESFAFRIEPRFWVVLLAGICALFLVVVLVSFKAYRAANCQPIEVLRTD